MCNGILRILNVVQDTGKSLDRQLTYRQPLVCFRVALAALTVMRLNNLPDELILASLISLKGDQATLSNLALSCRKLGRIATDDVIYRFPRVFGANPGQLPKLIRTLIACPDLACRVQELVLSVHRFQGPTSDSPWTLRDDHLDDDIEDVKLRQACKKYIHELREQMTTYPVG